MLTCYPRSVYLRGCLWVKSMLGILYKISWFQKVLLEVLRDMESVWNTKDGDIKYVFVGCAESCAKLGKKRWIFSFVGHDCGVVSLYWRCFCIAMWFDSLKKVCNRFDIVCLSIAVKILFLFYCLANPNFFD